MAYTRYYFVSGLLCMNQYYSLLTHLLFRHPTPPRHRPEDCAIECFPPTPHYCNIYHTILAVAISCKGQLVTLFPAHPGDIHQVNPDAIVSHCTSYKHCFKPTLNIHYTRLAITRDCFTPKLYCWNQSSFCYPPPTCKAYPIAILLHRYCAKYVPPPPPPLYAIYHSMLVMAISCKGQYTS